MNMERQKTQARHVAAVALDMPGPLGAPMTNGAVLTSLNEAYQAGYEQATADLATGILGGPLPHWLKRQAP